MKYHRKQRGCKRIWGLPFPYIYSVLATQYILATLKVQQELLDDYVTKQALRKDETTVRKLSTLFGSVATTGGIGEIPHLMHSWQQIAQRSCINLKQGHRQY